MSISDYLTVHPEVADALTARRAVVALESTVIAHGLPRIVAAETARAVEAAIRAGGAVPATIAVLGGRIHIGLDDEGLARLTHGPPVLKLSRRDLAAALATGDDGATTVSATMIAASLVGIRIFATGGIGGVHRGAGETFDISADLNELARTGVAVVCAGAKSILDLPKTLEYLETFGVPVLGLGTGHFPAFYVRDSGLPVSHICAHAAAVAQILKVHWLLSPNGGVVVANPIPESDALPAADVEASVLRALKEAKERDISGAALTPFLLNRLAEASGGRTLLANIALLKHNATAAAAIASAYRAKAGPERAKVATAGR